ncbi:hypothetical protein SAMN04487905_10638 [Actinopolyspora xinjiangensis]|uniref:Helix-turn-helix domain-containing protein n=1 Tax=Actinopolyspora xinjiangensis TaxID=405564 RepID=A0A1H0U3X5_9ACTN|nr:hypothetical protein [Actinopolyspora xinjiangensis]SDP60992.1 hypothetical protein SAMN04487905_10638 [Actinopolyspora xinjiangensis]
MTRPDYAAPCRSPECPNTAHDGNLCSHCLGGLLYALRGDRDGTNGVADLAAELDITITRQAVTTDRVGSRGNETPVPFHVAASDARRDLHNVLGTWARDLWETYDGQHSPGVVDTLGDIAGWIARHPTWLAGHPAAGELVDELRDAIARAWRVVDLAPERLYCGPCPHCRCGIYARPDRDIAGCRECGGRYEVATLREQLLDAARDTLATAAEAARALPALLGRDVSVNSLRKWAHEGRLAKHAPLPGDSRQRPRYRLGDIIDMTHRTTAGAATCAS